MGYGGVYFPEFSVGGGGGVPWFGSKKFKMGHQNEKFFILFNTFNTNSFIFLCESFIFPN